MSPRVIAFLAAICILFSAAISADQNEDIIGAWQGTLTVSGVSIRLVFKIEETDKGALTGTMDSPDQGAVGLPVQSVIFENDSLHIRIPTLQLSLDGQMQSDRTTIVCDFRQGGMTIPLTLERTDKPASLERPQNPVPPFPYRVEDVTYPNSEAGITLAGTLTLPDAGRPAPVVILISGSGAQDRDETIFAHRPFWVLADHLTRHGIAVLRVDDRGVGGSTGDFATATSRDFASDVLAGVAYLKSRDEIDGGRIGLIGHSEGGVIAPMVAEQSKDIAFIVLMGGTGVPGDEVLYEQSRMLYKAAGIGDKLSDWNYDLQRKLFDAVKSETDRDVLIGKIEGVFNESLARLSEDEKQEIGLTEADIKAQVPQLLSPWLAFFLTYDPRPALKKVACPVLALIGEKDLQVSPGQNLPAIEKALKAGGNRDVTVKELPGLNHLFQTAETGQVYEYHRIEETIAPLALDTIADWILERTGEK